MHSIHVHLHTYRKEERDGEEWKEEGRDGGRKQASERANLYESLSNSTEKPPHSGQAAIHPPKQEKNLTQQDEARVSRATNPCLTSNT